MSGQDDQLEEWIIRDDLKKERRARIVPSSSERLVAENPGDGESALRSVASWMDLQRNLPIVELATLSPRTVTITFSEPVVLPEPWVSQQGQSGKLHDQWGITLQHAMGLRHGDGYGWQISGMTGLGTLADGSRAFINTSRWGILGIAGTPEWTRNLMITQVMNQAAEPWSEGQVIWLVGYGETAEKLIQFLSPYHPHYRFKTADALSKLVPSDLELDSATIYVMGSNSETEAQYLALNAPHVGMITDRIVSDQCMFLSERSEGGAVLGPFNTNLHVFPNISTELISAMDRSWEANEKLIADESSTADFERLLTSEVERSAEAEIDSKQVDEEFKSLVGHLDDPVEPVMTIEPVPSQSDELKDREEQNENQSDSPSISVTKLRDEDIEAEVAPKPLPPVNETEILETKSVSDEQSPVKSVESSIPSSGIYLSLLGQIRAQSPEVEVKDRSAAALALLWLSEEPVTPQMVSEMLWPGDETEGHTTRTRRSRLLAKIRECAGSALEADAKNWTLDRTQVVTDYDHIANVFEIEPLVAGNRVVLNALKLIEVPLSDADEWAGAYQSQIRAKLHALLSDLKDKALDADAFDIAKAANAATTRLGKD